MGRSILASDNEARARVDAFLGVPLYAKIFERYKGYTLPPAPALEKEMVAMGVASKQADRARQAFMRAARQAGFFAHGEDRLVRPQLSPTPTTRPVEPTVSEQRAEKTGGGGDGQNPRHPFIEGLLKTLPDPETEEEWPLDKRVKWLQTAANIFDLVYKGEGGIRVEAGMAQRSPRPHE